MPTAIDNKLNIIVIGAGIAGLGAAIALRDHNVTILEQSRMKEEVGAAIHLGPNASRITLAWGMDPEKTKSCPVNYYHELTFKGDTCFKVPMKGLPSPWYLQHRVDLHNELRRLATREDGPGSPAVIRTAAKVVEVNPESGSVKLADGETLTADVIIGADGIHSEARTAVLGERSYAKPSGHSAYRALIPREVLAKKPHLLQYLDGSDGSGTGFCTFMGPDRRLVAYPCRNATLLNIVAIVPDTEVTDSKEAWHVEGNLNELLEAFESFGSEARDILSCVESCALYQLREQDPLPTWTKGRVIIIGDAAHAMLPHQGQGGGQAIEDAEALGVLLPLGTSPSAENIAERLELTQKIRYERASKIQGYSREKALGAKEGEKIVNAQEFAGYNFGYRGAREWAKGMGIEV